MIRRRPMAGPMRDPEVMSPPPPPAPEPVPAEELEELLTVEEVARVARVLPPAVRRWLRSGQLRGLKVGPTWRVTRGELVRFLNRGEERALDALTVRVREMPAAQRAELARWLDARDR
jgi:excisionase family DNA binding protein